MSSAQLDRTAPHAGIYGPGGQIGFIQNGQTFGLDGQPKTFVDEPPPGEPDEAERRTIGQLLDEALVDLPDGPFVLVGKCRKWIVEYLALEARGRVAELHAFSSSFDHIGDDLHRLRNIVYHEGDPVQIPPTLDNVALVVLDYGEDFRHQRTIDSFRAQLPPSFLSSHGRTLIAKPATAPDAPKAGNPAAEQVPLAEASWDDLRALAVRRNIKAASKAFVLAELAKAGVTHFNPAEL